MFILGELIENLIWILNKLGRYLHVLVDYIVTCSCNEGCPLQVIDYDVNLSENVKHFITKNDSMPLTLPIYTT